MHVEVRMARREDIPLLRLMTEVLPPYGFRAISGELVEAATTSRYGLTILAQDRATGAPAGYVIAVTHPRRFWVEFCRRYPVAFASVLLHRLRSLLRLSSNATSRSSVSGTRSFRWAKSHASGARVLFIGVLPHARRMGVAALLYDCLCRHLRSLGCTCVEAHIDVANTASLALHKNTGWCVLETVGDGYKALLRLKA